MLHIFLTSSQYLECLCPCLSHPNSFSYFFWPFRPLNMNGSIINNTVYGISFSYMHILKQRLLIFSDHSYYSASPHCISMHSALNPMKPISWSVLTAHGGPWDQCTVAWENLTLTDGHYVLEPRDISFNERV